jgi:hypothetical protein
MKQFTPEERQRLEARYAMLDLAYHVLRQCATLQREAILKGDYGAVLIADTMLMTVAGPASRCWSDIQSMLVPAAESVSTAEPDATEPEPPVKETIQ